MRPRSSRFTGTASLKVRPKTLASYEWIIEHHLIPGLGAIRLTKLSPQDVQAFLANRLECGRLPKKRGKETVVSPDSADSADSAAAPKEERRDLTPRTVQHIHATLRTALDRAEKWGLIVRKVASLVEPPSSRRSEVKALTVEEAVTFLDAMKGDRLTALYSVAMAVGLRLGEALALRWIDVDLDKGLLRVEHALQRIKGKLQLVEPKTSKSRRAIRLPQVAISALWEHRARQLEERALAGAAWNDSGFVFTTTVGTPLDGPTVTHRFQKNLAKAGLPRMRFHDLRHTCATLLMAQGVHPRLVMDILGHSQISLTMNLYSHVIPAMQVEVAARMDEMLSPVAVKSAVSADKKAAATNHEQKLN
jgi:integrase